MIADRVTEKLLPQNVEAERAVLGSLLIDPDALALIRDWLHADHFPSGGNQHGDIYQTICDLTDAEMGCNLLTLIDELERRNLLESAGGASYVSSLANQVPTSADIESYARIVQRAAVSRRLVKVGAQIANLGYHDPEPATGLAQAERLVREVADSVGMSASGRLRLPDAPDMAEAWMERFTERIAEAAQAQHSGRAEDALPGLPTGLRQLDSYLGGLERGKLITVAARPGHGKSALAQTIALNMARAGYRVGMFSLEMAAQDVMTRALSQLSGVPHERLRMPVDFTDDEWDALLRAYGVYHDLPLALDDTRELTVNDLAARARRFTLQHGALDVLLVDYLQIMSDPLELRTQKGSAGSAAQNRQQSLGRMVKTLRNLAAELDCCVLLLAQLNRAVEQRLDKRPQLSDLRESGDIENDSDAVLFLWTEEKHKPDTERRHLTDVHVAKNRASKTGEFTLYFDMEHAVFRGLTTLDDAPAGRIRT